MGRNDRELENDRKLENDWDLENDRELENDWNLDNDRELESDDDEQDDWLYITGSKKSGVGLVGL
ncbi:hypothetical protein BGZ90_006547 [Linnemannia elongata]|nr:hypothetical protein BGZ90_006547 [Linnemannia elongata]